MSHSFGKSCSQDASRRHGFAVQPGAETQSGFDRMSEGMAEIRSARSPDSRSSADTTIALFSHERVTA
jgi:hypothetical protein